MQKAQVPRTLFALHPSMAAVVGAGTRLLCFSGKTLGREELSSNTRGLLSGWSGFKKGALSELRHRGRVLRALELDSLWS